MHFAVILLVVVTAVHCQIPGWEPWMGIGPITWVCRGQGSKMSCFDPLGGYPGSTTNYPTGESSSTPASESTPSMRASPIVFKR
ncbi:unnamed protein product [Haemonchus placei]|uniref:Secreted protein n=1 Tax=Haemonchus placei TaxID=6290 RepID=A0A0N4X106_HAEPC|nr:unnamed protein product [Haemonchus placei]